MSQELTRHALAALACTLLLAWPAQAKQHRSHAAKHHFMVLHPCPGGKDVGSTHRCRGYVVDHVNPLACGGIDGPENMAWQTKAEGLAKDRWERQGCSTPHP